MLSCCHGNVTSPSWMKCQHQVELATFGTEQYATYRYSYLLSIHYDHGYDGISIIDYIYGHLVLTVVHQSHSARPVGEIFLAED